MVKDVVPEAVVLLGPSLEVYMTGQQISCKDSFFWDDELM